MSIAGREMELDAISRAIDALPDGHGHFLLFAGGAGMGKSRLAAEAMDLGRQRGVLCAWGRCRETEGAPAYWPWTQLLRALRAELGDALELAMGRDAEVLAPLLGAGGTLAGLADPFGLYDAMSRVLAKIASDRPLLLVLDDLHGADVGSLRMLRFVASDLEPCRIILVGTYRDEELDEEHVLRQVIYEATSHRGGRLFALDGLATADVAAIISSITGAPIDLPGAEPLRERTGGNPFFVTELARLGVGGPAPHGVREAIRARLSRLPEPTRALLSASSVLGRDFGSELLEDVAELSGVSLIAALQPAAQARLIASDPERQGRYRFVHALVQEVLYADLAETVRRATHERAIAAIDARGPEERGRRLEELAFHACSAIRDTVTRARAADVCRQAGDRAMISLAYEDGARWFRRSRELMGESAPLELTLAEADAWARTPHATEARARYEAAFERAEAAGDGRSAGRAALGVADVVVSAGVIDQSLLRLLERAERLVAEDDPMSARLKARRAIELYWQPDRGPSRELAAKVLARAEASGDTKSLGAALHARRFTLRGPEDLAERIALGERLVALAIETRDEALELSAYAWLIPEHLAAGDMTSVDRAQASLEDLERRVRRPLARWNVLLYAATRAVFEGRFEAALATIEKARLLGLRAGIQPAEMYAVGQRAVVLRDLGRAEEAIAPLRELAGEYPILVTLQCELAMFLADVGRSAEARELLDRFAPRSFAAVPRDSLWRASIAFCAQAAATLGSAEHALTAGELLRPFLGINVVQGVPNAWGATDHYVGVAMAAAGRLDSAVTHFEEAVRLHTLWGASALAVGSRAELASALQRRGRADDRARVLGLVATVRSEALRLGIIRPLLAREERSTAEGTTHASHGLTEQELKILRLLASGLANKEIAQTLRISVHTVERHVANVYAKIGARNRAEAATYAASRGLSG